MQETGKQPLISVILPIYNVGTYLGKCLESICGQTWENWELICVDDGSTDHTRDLAQRYAEIDRRIRVYQQKHGGVSTARNLGLSYAAGKYVLFVDGDDWLNLEMLRVLAEEAEKSRADMVVCSARIMENEKEVQDGRADWLKKSLAVRGHMVHLENEKERWRILDESGTWPFLWNKMIRREVLEEYSIRFSSGLALGEDGLFIQIVCQYIDTIAFVPDVLYYYRWQRRDSATMRLGQQKENQFMEHMKVFREMLKFWQKQGKLERLTPYILIWSWSFLYQHFVCLSGKEQKNAAEKFHHLSTQYELSKYTWCIQKRYQAAFQDMDYTVKQRSGLNCWIRHIKYRVQNKLRLRHEEDIYEINM